VQSLKLEPEVWMFSHQVKMHVDI